MRALSLALALVLAAAAAPAVAQAPPAGWKPFYYPDLHVAFMAGEPSRPVVDDLDRDRFRPEEFVVQGHDLYLYLPNGVGRTKLPAYLDRQLKTPFTIRNWNTVMKLLELSRQGTG